MKAPNNIFNFQLLDILMKQTSIGICCLDKELRFICINDKLAKINGISADEHIGRHIQETIPAAMPAVAHLVNRTLLTGESIEDHELCCATALHPGVQRSFRLNCYPARDDSAKIVGFIIIAEEVTKLKKAEEEIREREEWLVCVNQILHAALTCETERDLGLTCLNVIQKITRSHFGFIAELKGGLSNIAVSTPGWDACKGLTGEHGGSAENVKIRGIYGRVISDRRSLFTNDLAHHPDSVGLPANHPPLSSVLAVPLLYEGRVFGIIAVGDCQGGYTQAEQDTLEALSPSVMEAIMRKRAKDELEAFSHELELRVEQRTREYLHAEKLTAIGKLSASIAHEFNSPLQAVMTVLKTLQLCAGVEGEDRKLLDLAVDESKRMKNLIKSLQDFYRPSSGRKVLMDVHASIDSILLLCKVEFTRKKISTILHYSRRLPQIMAIPDQIKQVFLNLLDNAVDACLDRGGVVSIRTWRKGNRVAVAIKDTGIGISPDKIDRIFQPFYTTKAVVKGTGLGLSVCHGIIQSHGGEIRVTSKQGEGCTFTVYLPIDDPANPEG